MPTLATLGSCGKRLKSNARLPAGLSIGDGRDRVIMFSDLIGKLCAHLVRACDRDYIFNRRAIPMCGKEKSVNIEVKFARPDVDLITQSLPLGIAEKRLQLLPKILQEWSSIELPRHLSLESLKIIRERRKKVEVFEKYARALLQAFDALDDAGLRRIAYRIATNETPIVTQTEFTTAKQELDALHDFLTRLASVEPHASQKSKGGRQRNYIAYVVILDIAAIFEWITKTEATREVDRGGKGDIGPFWKFAEAIWPLVFGRGKYGLSSAIKNWAGVKSGEKSPLIANIALRHPSWGVFDK